MFVVGGALGSALAQPGHVVMHLVFGQDDAQMSLALSGSNSRSGW
jgi:hypothetical protein